MPKRPGHVQPALGIATIFVSHDQAGPMRISDRLVVISHGRVMQTVRPGSVPAPVSHFVANFFGRVNLLPIEIDDVVGPQAVVLLQGTAARRSTSTKPWRHHAIITARAFVRPVAPHAPSAMRYRAALPQRSTLAISWVVTLLNPIRLW